ncbi:MAG: RDD family protein [Rhodospirillales bacterium]
MNTETTGAQAAPQGQMQSGVQYGGFWIRLAAYIIDSVILIFIILVVTLLYTLVLGLPSEAFMYVLQGDPVMMVTQLVLGILYFAGFNSSKMQATPGKRVLGLKVTDAAGNKISFLRAFGRYLAMLVSAFILGIGYIMIAFTNRKRGLHDMMAGTLVVKR